MKNSLFLCLSLVCLSHLSIASEQNSSKQYVISYTFGSLKVDVNNKDHHTMAEKMYHVINNQGKLDSIRVLSKDSDIKLFMKNINLILELEDLVIKNEKSVGLSNQAQILNLTRGLKKSYLDKLEDSKQF